MRRSYRPERYLEWLARIRGAIDGIAVSTDIIVGFPGETESDFAATLEAVEEARFESAFMFQYSPRPGTRAADFPDQVPAPVVQERFERLVTLQSRIAAEQAAATVGRSFEVLVEGGDRKGLSTQSRTRTNRIVHLAERLEPGTFAEARIVASAAHHLSGELVRDPVAIS
jgi:tRNA-2-methylthio-N6-dimethylallyladenosine synthase